MSLFGSGAFGAAKPQNSIFGSFGNNQATTATTPAAQPGQTTTGFGGFGQQQQQQQQQQTQPSGGLFGQTNTNNATNPQPAGGFNLFGTNNNASNASQQPTNTSIFGAPLGQPPQQQPQNTGFFGQSTTNSAAPSLGGNLFGQNAATNPTSNTASAGFGSFGSLNPAQQQSTQQPPPAGGSLFGGFGSSTVQQPTNTPAPTFFGQAQPAQTQQQAQNALTASTNPLFTRTTKFNDLPEEIKKTFETLDSHIQGRVQISTELRQHKLGEEPQKGAEQIRDVHKDLVATVTKLRADLASMRELRTNMDQSVQDTIAATRIIDAFKSPQSSQQSVWLKNYAAFPMEFFSRVTEELRERMQWFNTTLEQIERRLASEANHSVSITPQAITTTLQAQHSSFVALANKTAALDAEMEKLKATYRQLWRARTGSARDPFNEVDRGTIGGGEVGLEGLSVQ